MYLSIDANANSSNINTKNSINITKSIFVKNSAENGGALSIIRNSDSQTNIYDIYIA